MEKFKIVKTEKYLLAVCDEEIKAGDWHLNTQCNRQRILIDDGYQHHGMCACKKIMAHLPLNDAPVLNGLPLLPELKKPLSEEELIASGKKIWKDMPILKKDGGYITSDTIKILIDNVIESTWRNAKTFFAKNQNLKDCTSILDDIQQDLADYQNEIGVGTMDGRQWRQVFIDKVIASITSYEDLSTKQSEQPQYFNFVPMLANKRLGVTVRLTDIYGDIDEWELQCTINSKGQIVLNGSYE